MSKKKKVVKQKKSVVSQLKKSRSKIYSQRRNLLLSFKKKSLTEKQKKSVDKKILSLNKKLEKINSKIFKKSDKYKKIKTRKREIQTRINRLKKKALTDPKRSNEYYGEIRDLAKDLRDINSLLGKEIVVEKGVIKFTQDLEQNSTFERVQVWQLKNIVSDLISTNKFDQISIDGELYSLVENRLSAIWALDEYIGEIHASQADKNVSTPMAEIWAYFDSKLLTVK